MSELLTPSNIAKVIKLLAAEKPITKKAACEILGINYNTARLAKIIEDYKAALEKDKEQRAKKRGTPATPAEISYAVTSYLEGSAVSNIANALYRNPEFVNKILEDCGVPRRASSYNYFNPPLIPDECLKDRFSVGEVAYSAQYDCMCRIDAEMPHKIYGWAYRVWLIPERWQQYAHVPSIELASLTHLIQKGYLTV